MEGLTFPQRISWPPVCSYDLSKQQIKEKISQQFQSKEDEEGGQ